MASFYGSLLIDVFQGHAHEVNTYYFELGELSVVDVIVGADGGDYIHFVDGDNSGLTGTNIFINVTGVDRIYVDAASNIDIPNALVTSSNSTDPHDFTCHGSEDADVFNASAVTTTTHTLWLNGNGGDDVLYGGGGDGGLYEGGDGNDSIYVTEAVEEVNGEADDDTIRGSAAALDGDTLDGGSGDDELIFNTSGTVTLTLKNIETVTLGSAVNHVTLISEGHGQGDTFTAHVEGGSSADTVTVEDGSSILISDTYENFEIDGNGGNDILTGGDSDDTLNGGSDTDALSGGAGDDTLDGAGGNDVLFGESGADTFVVRAGNGSDIIGDFTAGADRLLLQGYAAVQSLGDLLTHARQVGGDVAFDLGGGEVLILQNVTLAALTAADILFHP